MNCSKNLGVNAYYTEKYVTTEDNKVVVSDEPMDGVDYGYQHRDVDYDEDEYVKDVMRVLPYKRFVDLFDIDKDEFEKEDYEELIIDQIMFDRTAFLGWDYKTFTLFVNGSHVSEDNYMDRMKILKELGIPDPEDYVLDEEDY